MTTKRRSRSTGAVLALLAAATIAFAPGAAAAPAAAPAPGLTVVVMGGLGSTTANYPSITTFLRGKGYTVKVFSPAHGGWQWDEAANTYRRDPATGGQIQERIGVMTVEFAGWVRDNVTTTKIALVPVSAGGLIARNYVKTVDQPGPKRVEKVIMNGVANYGTQLDSAGTDYAVGSPFLAGLNAGDVSLGSVGYWSFITSVDYVVFPYENQWLPRTAGTTSTSLSYPYVTHPIPGIVADPQVTNLIIQEQCPWALISHIGMTSAKPVQSAIEQALRGVRDIRVTC